MNGSEKLTDYEKRVARACGITSSDCVRVGSNCVGAVWRLYNGYFSIEGTFSGYSKPYIYRALIRAFIDRAEKACWVA